MRLAKVFFLVTALVALPSVVRAEEGPVPSGTFALGAERMTGFFHTILDREGVDETQKYDEFTILGNLSLTAASLSPYTVPRFAMDGFVTDGLSIGAGAGFLYFSEVDSDAPGEDGSTVTAFLLEPRIGYATFFGESTGLWPRVGLSIFHVSSDPDNEEANGSTANHFALELEVPFLFGLSEDVWLHVGPIVGIPLSGSTESDAPGAESRDYTFTTFGVTAGLTAAF
jgi:hypothetical protein